MSKLNISISPSCLRMIILFFLLIIYVSARNIDSPFNNEYDSNDEEIKHPSAAATDKLFFSKNSNDRFDRSLMLADYNLPYGQVRLLPYKKRTIPIELQKALYAHGIVGRRR